MSSKIPEGKLNPGDELLITYTPLSSYIHKVAILSATEFRILSDKLEPELSLSNAYWFPDERKILINKFHGGGVYIILPDGSLLHDWNKLHAFDIAPNQDIFFGFTDVGQKYQSDCMCIFNMTDQSKVLLPDIAVISPAIWEEDSQSFLIAVWNMDKGRTELQHYAGNGTLLGAIPLPFHDRAFRISISPDKSKIAYSLVSDEEDEHYIGIRKYIGNLDESEVIDLGLGSSEDYYPAWSRDSQQLAFVGTSEADGHDHLYVIDADGQNKLDLMTLNDAETRYDQIPGNPAWSHDGKQLAIQSYVKLDGSTEGYALFVMNADGSQLRRVTELYEAISSIDWKPQR